MLFNVFRDCSVTFALTSTLFKTEVIALAVLLAVPVLAAVHHQELAMCITEQNIDKYHNIL